MISKADFARFFLRSLTPTTFSDLLTDEKFRADLDLKIEPTIALATDVVLRVPLLHSAIEQALSDIGAEIRVQLNQGGEATIVCSKDGSVSCHVGKRRFVLPESRIFSPDLDMRIAGLSALASHCLPFDQFEQWTIRIREGLSFSQGAELYDDVQLTPVEIAKSFSKEILLGELKWIDIVPHDPRYLRRLIWASDDVTKRSDLLELMAEGYSKYLPDTDELVRLKLALTNCGHGDISRSLNLEFGSKEAAEVLADLVAENGAPNMLVGLIEVLLEKLPEEPWLEKPLMVLVKAFLHSNPSSGSPRYRIASNLLLACDGYITDSGRWRGCSTFYRRLYASSQATLLQSFCEASSDALLAASEVMREAKEHSSLIGSLFDMHDTPNWTADNLSADKLYADHVGRLVIAFENMKDRISDGVLKELFVGDADSVHSCIDIRLSFLSGYLEGQRIGAAKLPKFLSEAIDEQLAARPISVKSFVALANSIPAFEVNEEHVEGVKQALKAVDLYIDSASEDHEIWAILSALATLAAIKRDVELTHALGPLFRRYTTLVRIGITPIQAFRLIVIASAAFGDKVDRANWIAAYTDDLTYSELSQDEAYALRADIATLTAIEPELTAQLTKARLVLSAVIK